MDVVVAKVVNKKVNKVIIVHIVMGFSRVWSYTLDSSLRCGKAYVSSKL